MRDTKLPELPGSLTQKQKDLALASVMADGWIEKKKGGVNARLGFQQSLRRSKPNFDQFMEVFKDFITEKPRVIQRVPPKSKTGELFSQIAVRTRAHKSFTKYYNEFRPNDCKKLISAVSFLKEELTFQALPFIIAQDGSTKSDQSLGVEIHFDNYGLESNARFCISLIEKFHILARPTYEFRGGKDCWKTYLSGDTWPIINKEVPPFLLEEMGYKIPFGPTKKRVSGISKQNLTLKWYDLVKDHPFREEISQTLPKDLLGKGN